jgi:hypothetical protein
MDLYTLRLRDADMERRFWASWSVPMLVGDVLDAISATVCGTLLLLHRLGSVRWDYVVGHIWWLVLGVVLSRIATIALVLTARQSYLRNRFALHAALKLYLIYLSPRFLGPGARQMGPHTWVVLGGKDGKVETSAGIVRALLLPTGAYLAMNHMVLPPFRLPWRLMAPLHLLHGAGTIAVSHRHVARLLGLFPRLTQDAHAICNLGHSAMFLLSGCLPDRNLQAACAGPMALSWTALFASLVLVLVVPLLYAYACAWQQQAPRLPLGPGARCALRPVDCLVRPRRHMRCSDAADSRRLTRATPAPRPAPQPSARPSAPSCTGSGSCRARRAWHGASTWRWRWAAACWRTAQWMCCTAWAWPAWRRRNTAELVAVRPPAPGIQGDAGVSRYVQLLINSLLG